MKKKRLSARWLHKIAGNRFFFSYETEFLPDVFRGVERFCQYRGEVPASESGF